MSNEVEMNDVKIPLMTDDPGKVPDVDFKGSKDDCKADKHGEEFRGLTKEELEKFANDPFWKRLRLILFILFWIVWAGMLIAAILIVVFSPKCPKRPVLQFWESKTGYTIDTFAFSDSNGDGVGDFAGLLTKLDYIQKQVGAGYIIMDPIFKGQYSSTGNIIGLVESFREFDSALGSNDTLKELIRECRKRGIEIVLTVNYNALSVNSALISKNSKDVLIPWESKYDNLFNRNGEKAKVKYEDNFYYSALESSKLLELNLENNLVIKEIKESIKLILDMGFRGVMLTDFAMYVENPDSTSKANYDCGSNWYKNATIGGQLFANSSLNLLKEIRQVINDIAKKTDKSRVLIIDAGDIGIGMDEDDKLLQYIEQDNLVDMIVSREFLNTRGWKSKCNKSKSSVKNYDKIYPINQRKKVGLASATSNSLRTTDLLKLAAPFLVQGNALLYYGSELGITSSSSAYISDNEVYPKNKLFTNISDEVDIRSNHFLMPWDNSGMGFSGSEKYKNYFVQFKTTVQRETAIGIGETILQLHQKLIRIRKEPSLLWGSMNLVSSNSSETFSYEVFTRQADGFPKIIVALYKDSTENGRVYSFADICSKFTPILVYPSNSNLEENKEIESKSIYLHTQNTGSVHVFKCAL